MQLTFEQMMTSGMHLGHQTRKWHPKMAAYTYGVRKGLHLLDLVKTRQQLLEARSFLAQQAGEGKTRLLVGTKPQAVRAVSEAARRARCFYVNERWLGGMLTNWRTVRSSLVRLHELERQERRGDWTALPKKEAAQLRQLKERLARYVGGLKGMRRLPDVLIVIGQQQELAAIAEARRLGIPVLSILDTDCDPELVQIGIPRNDDSAESIQLILQELVSAWREGLRVWRQRPARNARSRNRKTEMNGRPAKRVVSRSFWLEKGLRPFGCYKTKISPLVGSSFRLAATNGVTVETFSFSRISVGKKNYATDGSLLCLYRLSFLTWPSFRLANIFTGRSLAIKFMDKFF